MDLKKLWVKSSVIGETLPLGKNRRLSTGKLTLGGLVLAIAGLVIQYLS
jgi:hypothetical protein